MCAGGERAGEAARVSGGEHGSSLTPPPLGVGGYVCRYVQIWMFMVSLWYSCMVHGSEFRGLQVLGG